MLAALFDALLAALFDALLAALFDALFDALFAALLPELAAEGFDELVVQVAVSYHEGASSGVGGGDGGQAKDNDGDDAAGDFDDAGLAQ